MRISAVLLCFILLLASWTRVLAQVEDVPNSAPLILTDEQEKYPLGLQLPILDDPGGELTIDDVSSQEMASRFRLSQEMVPNYGFTDSAYWVRLDLRNESTATDVWLLDLGFANTQFVDLYTPLPDGSGFSVKQTGSLRPPDTRDIPFPRFVFSLPVPTGDEQVFYLRFQSGASMTLQLTLWEPFRFSKAAQLEQIEHGIFYGLMLGMLAYNLFLLVSLREKSYLYLVIYLASWVFFEAIYTGYMDYYVSPTFYLVKPIYQPISMALLFGSLIVFSDSFLEASKRLPKLHRLDIALASGWGILVILIPFISYRSMARLMLPWAIASLVAALLAGLVSLRLGYRSARFYMVAWLGLIGTLLITLMVRWGSIPSTQLAEDAYHFGIMWMAVSLSIALADQINVLKAETENANRDLQNSERRLTQTLEAMPVGVVVYGTDRHPTYMNKRTAEILSNPGLGLGPDPSFGRSLDEAMTYFSFQKNGSKEGYPIEQFPVYRALHGEFATADDIVTDLIDTQRALEAWASPVFDSNGRIESAVIAFQDITSRRQKDAELEEYRIHLEHLVQERTEELSIINQQLTDEVAERTELESLLHKRILWMSALSQARQNVTGTADLSATLERLSAEILHILEAYSVFLFRWGGVEGQGELFFQLMREDDTPGAVSIEDCFQIDSALRRELELGHLLTFAPDEFTSLPEPLRSYLLKEESSWLFLVPMSAGESSLGVLGIVLAQDAQSLEPAQDELILKIAFDLSSVVQYAVFRDQSRSLIEANERNRLARDLHDSVTQVLFSASLVAEVLPQIWRRDPDKAQQSLEELRRLTHGALAEMRTLLLELRPTTIAKTPLHELLVQLTEATTSRVQLPCRLFLERTPPLPEAVHMSIYRIAQEALNNITKHAQASQVDLTLQVMPIIPERAGEELVEVRLMIEDDGIGFAPEDKQVEHLGLGIMQERAADIGAKLVIGSCVGEGTKVELFWCGAIGKE